MKNFVACSPIGSPINYSLNSGSTPIVGYYRNKEVENTNNSFHNASFESSILSVIEDDDSSEFKMEGFRYENTRTSSLEGTMDHKVGKPFPLLKQRSLPTNNVIASYGSQNYRGGENSQYHPLFGVKVVPNNNSQNVKGDNLAKDMDTNDEWIDHFGMEMDLPFESEESSLGFGHEPLSYKDNLTRRQTYSVNKMSQSNDGVHKPSSVQSNMLRPNISMNNQKYVSNQSTNNGHTKHCSRTIAIQSFSSYPFDVMALFEDYEIRSHKIMNSTMLISFYDIRESQRVMQNLNGKNICGVPLDLNYYLLREFSNPEEYNQGTLVIFNLDMTISNSQLMQLFGAYGDIKEIRESPNKKHKFIEFYDVRKAEEAMRHLNKTEVCGRKIKIEPSRPGGSNKVDNTREKRNNNYSFYNKVSTSAPSYSFAKMDRFSHSDGIKKNRLDLGDYRGD